MTLRGLALALLCIAPSPALAGARYALLIGANAGWANDRPLRHAESDAAKVADVLTELGGFEPARVEVLRDPDTTDVRARLRQLGDRARASGADSLVLIYYSGHADGLHLHLRGAPLTWKELVDTLGTLPATVRLGLFDACRSGSVVEVKGAAPAATFELKAEAPVQGLALLSSSGADELSQETRAVQGSVFTHHLVSGLRGGADANGDGRVTLDEAYRYAAERTEADTAASIAPQRPAFRVDLKGQRELVLTRLESAQASLVLPRGPAQRYVVVDGNEWRLVAEGRSSPTADVVLAVRAGAFKVKRVLLDTLEVASVQVAASTRVAVSSLAFVPVALSVGLVKGQPDALDVEGQREFRRGEGLRMLAEGRAGEARVVFDQLLRERPDDVAALRGVARAMVREAESLERVGEYAREVQDLKDALRAEPSLADDPDFARWYRRMVELEADARRGATVTKAVQDEIAANPRLRRRWGIGLDLITTRGVLVFTGTAIFAGSVFIDVGFAPIAPGFDIGVRWAPMGMAFSPFVGAGGFLNVAALGGGGSGTVVLNGNQYNYDQIWSQLVHVDAGVQYFGDMGFRAELGIGGMIFPHPSTREPIFMFMPEMGVGWCF